MDEKTQGRKENNLLITANAGENKQHRPKSVAKMTITKSIYYGKNGSILGNMGKREQREWR